MNRAILLATLMGLAFSAAVEGEKNVFKEGLTEVNSAISEASKELQSLFGSSDKGKEKIPVAPAASNESAENRPKRGLLERIMRRNPRAASAEQSPAASDVHSEHQDMTNCKVSHSKEEGRPKRQVSVEQSPSQNPLSGLANFGSSLEGAKMFGSLFGSSSSSPSGSGNSGPSNPSTSEIMSSLTNLVKSSQDSGSKFATESQQNVLQAGQMSSNAAQDTQKGFVGALTEIGKGLKQITQNNPSLVPDMKNLFSNVSSKLNSNPLSSLTQQSSSIIPASNSQQLADNLSKVTLPGLQTPA